MAKDKPPLPKAIYPRHPHMRTLQELLILVRYNHMVLIGNTGP